jgi:hypothetical protein
VISSYLSEKSITVSLPTGSVSVGGGARASAKAGAGGRA